MTVRDHAPRLAQRHPGGFRSGAYRSSTAQGDDDGRHQGGQQAQPGRPIPTSRPGSGDR